MADFLSPAFAELDDEFFEVDTDVLSDESSDDERAPKRISPSDRLNQTNRDSVEVIPNSQPSSSGSSIRTGIPFRRKTDMYAKISESGSSDEAGSRPAPRVNGSALKPPARKKRMGPRSKVKRRSSDSESSDASVDPIRAAEKLVSVPRTERYAAELDDEFVLPDDTILMDDDTVRYVDPDRHRKRRNSGKKKDKSKRTKVSNRQTNGRKYESEDDSSDPEAPVTIINSDGEEDKEYVVEKILKKKYKKKDKVYKYLIKWVGWDEEYNTWEPAENLTNCDQKLKEFEERLKRRQAAGKEVYDVEFTSDDETEVLPHDDVVTYDLKELLHEVLAEAGVDEIVSRLPDNVSPQMKCLKGRKWLSDFLIDDTIFCLLQIYRVDQTKAVYVPHHYFVQILHSVENQNALLPNEVLHFLYNQNAGLADKILVCTSTATGSGDEEAEHFALGIIDRLEEKIILLDSMKESGSNPRKNIFKALNVILAASRKLCGVGKPAEPEFIYSRDCPSQENGHDCGVFVIMNVVTLLTKKHVSPNTIKGQMMRRFMYSLMNGRQVKEPAPKKTALPADVLIGATKREARGITSTDIEVVRKNTNKMIVEARFLKKN